MTQGAVTLPAGRELATGAADWLREPLPPAEAHVIGPKTRRVRLRDVFTSLPVARMLLMRDFKARFKQSLFGPVWLVIQPLGMLTAFTVIFDGVAEIDTAGIPYPLFAVVGITVWTYVVMALSFGVRCQVANKVLIKRLPCPRIAFVSASLAASAAQLLATFALSLAAIFAFGRTLPLNALLVPVAVVWLTVLLWGLVLICSTVMVRFRDTSSVVKLVLQGALFLSPVAYPASEAPASIAAILTVNPLTGVIEFWRWCLLGSSLDPLTAGISVAWTVLLAVAGWKIFTRFEPKFADVI